MSNQQPVKRGPGRPPGSKKIAPNDPRVDALTQVGFAQRADFSIRTDSWANFYAGIGGAADKRRSTFMDASGFLQDVELENLYGHDGLAQSIIDIVADDMTREWIDLDPEEDDDDEDTKQERADMATVAEELEHQGAETLHNEALKWARLYGGAVIYLAILDGQTLDKPVNVRGIRGFGQGRVITRSDIDITMSQWNQDPNSDRFGQPENFLIWFQNGMYRTSQYVHWSRVIVYKGKPIPRGRATTLSMEQQFWGQSVLQAPYDALKDLGGSYSSVANLLYEFVIAKYKVKGLASMLANGNESQAIGRMNNINLGKSMMRGVLLDSDGEDFGRDTASVSGMDGLLDRLMQRLTGMTRIPMTRMFGISPGGLGNDGKSDMRNYYDMVKTEQKTKLKPALRQHIDYIVAYKKVTSTIDIVFRPLEQMNAKEKAEIKKLEAEQAFARAQMYSQYVTQGALDGQDVRTMEWAKELGEHGLPDELPEPEPLPLPEPPPGSAPKPPTPAAKA